MKNIKRISTIALSLILVMMALCPAAYASEARYIDILRINSGLDIQHGIARCSVWAEGASLNNEFRVTMVLYQDDNDYATWTYSELFSVDAVETCYVTQGHEYYVGVYVAVYDPNGNFIEDAIAYTGTYYY